jgi:hypothetical protein
VRSASSSRRWLSTGAPRFAATACVAVALVATLAACSQAKPTPFVPAAVAPASPAVSTPPPTQKQTTLALLALLEDRTGPAPTGYAAALFGTAFHVVAGGSHCNARDFVFKRDLTDITYQTGSTCSVFTGVLFDHYTGSWFWYAKREPVHSVELDYVVGLSDAWANGASAWSSNVLSQFANDPQELVAASTAAVTLKAGRSADAWLPADVADQCTYVAQQVAVKAAYLLTVTAAERAAMVAVLNGCPDTFAVPKATTSPPPKPTPSPTVKPRPSKSSTAKPTTKPSASKTP